MGERKPPKFRESKGRVELTDEDGDTLYIDDYGDAIVIGVIKRTKGSSSSVNVSLIKGREPTS